MAKPPLRILMTDPHLQGGGQVSYVIRLTGALTRSGHEVMVGCKPGSVLVGAISGLGGKVHDQFVFKGGARPRTWLRDIREMAGVIRSYRPDVIHVNGSQDHWIAGLTEKSLGRPACLIRTRHNTYPIKANLPNRILNRAWTDFQIVVCDEVREHLAQHPAFDAKRMCSIHNGVDADQFRPDAAKRLEARAEFGYEEAHLVCGIAARLVPAKGHEFLFRAAALLRPEFPQLRVLVLGQGTLEPHLRRIVHELGIEQAVRFAGFRTDMAYCTQAFDIAALPSVDCDTSSFSLKEEMAAEKPVVASDYGGLKEIIADGVEGWVAPAGTVAPLAEALRRLLLDPAMRAAMGARGRQRVLREFSLEVFAERTEAAYRQAIEIYHARTSS